MTVLLHRVRPEKGREHDRASANEPGRDEHREQGDEPTRSEHDRDLQSSPRDRSVREWLVGRYPNPTFLERDLTIENGDRCRHALPLIEPARSAFLTLFIERGVGQT